MEEEQILTKSVLGIVNSRDYLLQYVLGFACIRKKIAITGETYIIRVI